MIEMSNLKEALNGADLVISGEGKLDHQTLAGKVIAGVADLAKTYNVPTGILCGLNEGVQAEDLGLVFIREVMDRAKNQTDAMKNASRYLFELAQEQFADFNKS